MKLNPLIIIPARMAAQRFPGKPLALINGVPMIVHVLKRANSAAIAPVYVACAEKEIADVVKKAGGNAVLTDQNHPSGTDRINEALGQIDKKNKYNVIINLQGDLPTIEPKLVKDILKPHGIKEVDISTLVCAIKDKKEFENPNVVKAVVDFKGADTGRCTTFTRANVPNGYHHIGIYAYKRPALEKFTSLPQSPMEKKEKLEQLRALENGMRIDAVLVDTIPLGVDTEEDLIKAGRILEGTHV